MPLVPASRRTLNPLDLEAGDQLFGRQAELPVVADPSLPAFRCALVQNVMDDDRRRFVLQETREDASVVAPHGDEPLVPDERDGVVPERGYEQAARQQCGGSACDEAIDSIELWQMRKRVSHAQDGRRCFRDVALKRQQVIVYRLDREVAAEFRQRVQELSRGVDGCDARASARQWDCMHAKACTEIAYGGSLGERQI